jgi:hypothetical protein
MRSSSSRSGQESVQFVRFWLRNVEGREKEREALEENRGRGVYPSVANESVRKGKKIEGLRSFPWDDDGDEGSTSD